MVVRAQNIYRIPLGSSDNHFEIKLNNTNDKLIDNILITPYKIPSWVKVNEEFISLEKIEPGTSEDVIITFDVTSEAPINSEEDLVFEIQSKDGKALYKSISINIILPDKYELAQNYPNPFNPTTRIKYAVQKDGFVNLSVYNILGEKVADVVNEIQKAGVYEVTFDASNLSSGMYIYRIKVNNFEDVKKMMIMK
jgi:hypothetical protein